MLHKRLFVCLPILSLGAPLMPARARAQIDQDSDSRAIPDAEARRLYDDAHRHFRSGDYAHAIGELEGAYARTGAPALLFDLGQTSRLAGDCVSAVAYYRRFLSSLPAPVPRARAEAQLAALASCPVEKTQPAPANIAPSAPATTTTPPTGPAGAPIAVGAPLAPSLLTSSTTREVSNARDRRATGRRRMATICAIGAGALLATSGYFTYQAASTADDVSGVFKPGMTWSADDSHSESVGVRNEHLALGTGIAAAITAGVAIWLFATSAHPKDVAHASR